MSSSEPASPWSPEHSNNYGYTRRMMLAAIVCFLTVFLLVVFLHVYGKWLMRRRSSSDDPFLTIWNSPVALDRLRVPSSGTPLTLVKTGLDASLLASVPVFLYRKSEHGEGSECSICLSLLEEEDEAKALPHCGHCFHSQCIDSWLKLDSTCPVCRATVVVAVRETEKRDGEVRIEVGHSDPIGEHDDGSVVMVAESELDDHVADADTGGGTEPVVVVDVAGESASMEPGVDPLVGGGGGGCSFGSLRRMLGSRNRSERKSSRTNPNEEELEAEKV